MATTVELSKNAVPAALINRTGDFIEEYVKYADVFEAPPQAHDAVASSLIAATLNPNVWIENGAQKLTLDFWTLLLSGSGLGRNTLVSLLWPVIHQAGLGDLVCNTHFGSKQSLYQTLAEKEHGFFVWEELAACLKTLTDKRFGEAKHWLTDRYDNERIPADITYRITSKGSDTPPITFAKAPRINILATSSEDWFIDSLHEADTGGGFIPRWFLQDLPESDRIRPKPTKPDDSLVSGLAEHLKNAGKLQGPADLSQVEAMYAAWYRDTKERFSQQPNRALATAFWSRHRVHVLKLAVVHAVAETGTLRVTELAMQHAIESAKHAENAIVRLLPSGLNHEGAAVGKIAEAIHKAGVKGILKSELTRAFQSVKAYEREARIKTLNDGGDSVVFTRATPGRSAEVLVDAEFADQHQELFPNDTRKT